MYKCAGKDVLTFIAFSSSVNAVSLSLYIYCLLNSSILYFRAIMLFIRSSRKVDLVRKMVSSTEHHLKKKTGLMTYSVILITLMIKRYPLRNLRRMPLLLRKRLAKLQIFHLMILICG